MSLLFESKGINDLTWNNFNAIYLLKSKFNFSENCEKIEYRFASRLIENKVQINQNSKQFLKGDIIIDHNS